jgi:hypothetical protein
VGAVEETEVAEGAEAVAVEVETVKVVVEIVPLWRWPPVVVLLLM